MGAEPWGLLALLDGARGLPAGALRGGPDLTGAREERKLLAAVSIAGDRHGVGAALEELQKALGRCAADPLYLSVVEGVCGVAFDEALALSSRGNAADARRLLERIPKESRYYGPAYTLLSKLKEKK